MEALIRRSHRDKWEDGGWWMVAKAIIQVNKQVDVRDPRVALCVGIGTG